MRLEEISEVLELASKCSSVKSLRCLKNYKRLVEISREFEPLRVAMEMKGAWHHILPRSLFPEYSKSSWNLVFLTHKEHFVAHHLLFEIYGRSGKMAFAYHLMLNGKDTSIFTRKSNLDSLSKREIKFSEEHKKKLSESNLGKVRSEETRRRNSEAQTGSVQSAETVEKRRLKNTGKVRSDELKSRMSEINKGRTLTPEQMKKLSESHKGLKYDHVLRECPHCGKSGKGPAQSRWHFDNCKMNPNREV